MYIAGLCYKHGKFRLAGEYLDVFGETHDPNHPQTLSRMYEVIMVNCIRGRHDRALPVAKAYIEIKTNLGEDDDCFRAVNEILEKMEQQPTMSTRSDKVDGDLADLFGELTAVVLKDKGLQNRPLPAIPVALPGRCAVCYQPKKFNCSKCKVALYCGRDCQTKHWTTHKKECKVTQKVSIIFCTNR